MDKQKDEKKVFKTVCALHGTILCANPKTCDGITRICDAWKKHSTR